jgi:hypothetical protein
VSGFIVNPVTLAKAVIFVLFSRLLIALQYGLYKHAANLKTRKSNAKCFLGLQMSFQNATADYQVFMHENS